MCRQMLIAAVAAIAVIGPMQSARADVGRTQGSFNISSTGAATYSIPIWTPPGPHGIQPNLSLVYNSQASAGPMGPGWSLAGLSVISRCNKTYAQDGSPAAVAVSASDGYCLDGRRLRLTNGTYGAAGSTYQTEEADFSLVTAVGSGSNGPASFTVQTKEGLIYNYGTVVGPQWLVDKVTDPAGNTMTVQYGYGAPGTMNTGIPTSISYTPTSAGATTYAYTISLTYGAAQINKYTGFVSTLYVANPNELTAITVSNASSTTLRKYVLTYAPSPTTSRNRLVSVQECADSAQTHCLLATKITYQDGQLGVPAVTTPVSGVPSSPAFLHVADVNGDGRQDLIYYVQSGSNYTWYVQFAGAGGAFGSPVFTGLTTTTAAVVIDDFLAEGRNSIMAVIGGMWNVARWNGTAFTVTSTGLAADADLSGVAVSADVDGDGLPDLVTYSTSSAIYVRRNTSAGGAVSFAATRTLAYQASAGCLCTLVGNNSSGTSPIKHMDFNGDGREDLLLIQSSFSIYTGLTSVTRVLLSQGSTFSGSSAFTTTNGSIAPINWNDDACTDVVVTGYLNGSYSTGIYQFACNGATASTNNNPLWISGNLVAAIDWDGDGRTDVLTTGGANGTALLYRSTGDGFVAGAATTVPASGLYVLDQDGDGLDDLMSISTANGTVSIGLHASPGTFPDLVSNITDGYGVSFSPSYTSIARGSYSKGTGAIYPEKDIQDPHYYVVSQVVQSDGIGGTYTQTYTYGGARVNVQGRGFEGFQTQQIQDSRPNSVVERTTWATAFPFGGMVTEDDIFQNNGATPISKTTNALSTLAQATLSNAPGQQQYFPYVTASTLLQYELGDPSNSPLITTTSKSYQYDGWGNVTNQSTTVTDNDTGSPYSGQQWTSTTVSNITAQFGCTSLPTNVTVTNTAPGEPSITRTVSYTPDYAHCRETQQIVEPNSSVYKVTTSYGFDSFGNINSVAVGGINMASRTTLTNWGTTGQFPMSVTNALGQTTQYGYDFNLGVRTSATDPNNIQTQWQYDAFGRKSKEIRPDGTTTVWTYTDCYNDTGGCLVGTHGLIVQAVLYNHDNSIFPGAKTSYYDLFDRTLVTATSNLSGGSDRNEVSYDSFGRIHLRYMPCTWQGTHTSCPYATTYTYDALGRETQETRPDNANDSTPESTTISYQGRTTVVTDPKGKTTTKITTVMGQLGRTQDHDGYYQNFTYDAFGSLLSVTDSQSNALYGATYDYGASAFLRSTSDMDRGNWGYTPDALGEVVAYTDAKGTSFALHYDALSRQLDRTPNGGATTTWTWGTSASAHEIGRLQSVTSTGGPTQTYTYDSFGRLINKHSVSDTAYDYDYSYNANTGMLDTLTYPISTAGYRLKLQYAYQYGVLNQIKDYNAGTVFWQANAINPRGQITQETLGNGLQTNRSYDAVTGWINYIQSGPGGGAGAQNQSYLYDPVGNLTQRQNNALGLTESFYYDDLYRLTSSQLNGTTNLTVGYDATGNITSKSDVAAGATWTYDSARKHRLLQAGDSSHTLTYDANGNAITRNGYSITWSPYNYPTLINGNGASSALSYDANNALWKQVYTEGSATETTVYVDGANSAQVTAKLEKVTVNGTSDYRHYIYANGQAVAIMSRTSAGANTTRYVLRDALGSVNNITDSTGAQVVQENFTAFGAQRNPLTWSGSPTNGDQTTEAGITREGYTGHNSLGILQLNHMGGRVQDPVLGRFLSVDPTFPQPDGTQSYNRYAYVNNNPMTFVDPTGFAEAAAGDGPGDYPPPAVTLDPIVVTAFPDSFSTFAVGVSGAGPIPSSELVPVIHLVPPKVAPLNVDNSNQNSAEQKSKNLQLLCNASVKAFISGFAGGAVGGGAALAEGGPLGVGVGVVIGGLTGGVLGLLSTQSVGTAAGYGALGGANSSLSTPVSGALGGAAGGMVSYGLDATGAPSAVSSTSGGLVGGALSGAAASSIEGVGTGAAAGAAEGGAIGAAAGATSAATAAALKAYCGKLR